MFMRWSVRACRVTTTGAVHLLSYSNVLDQAKQTNFSCLYVLLSFIYRSKHGGPRSRHISMYLCLAVAVAITQFKSFLFVAVQLRNIIFISLCQFLAVQFFLRILTSIVFSMTYVFVRELYCLTRHQHRLGRPGIDNLSTTGHRVEGSTRLKS